MDSSACFSPGPKAPAMDLPKLLQASLNRSNNPGLLGLTREVVDSWKIVKKKSYIMFKAVQSPSLSSGQFWEEDFVEKVFDAVRDDLVSVSGAAELLGANYSDLIEIKN